MTIPGDLFELDRFVQAQNSADTFARAVEEIRAGKKRSHWMWFVFPQIAGLGSSAMAERFAISGTAEARAYLAHTLLGPRLIEVTDLMIGHRGKPLRSILGTPDDLKFVSSMTLFAAISEDGNVYAQALRAFGASPDPRTLNVLATN
jgi:uncharacterized protein (DUF1810 family)